jgi:hypothetical protein
VHYVLYCNCQPYKLLCRNIGINRQQEGTGQWLLNSDEFQEWLNQSNQTLFCQGIPGAGKAIMTSIVIDHLYTKYQSDVSVGIVYLYCDFRRQYKQRNTDLFASLLKQLVRRRHFIPASMQRLYERHGDRQTQPSLHEISQILQSIVAGYQKGFIVIDALDECHVSDRRDRKRLLSEIFNLQAKAGANLFATSRLIPDVAIEFEGKSTRLEIRAGDNDLQRYLDGHMSRMGHEAVVRLLLKNSAEMESKDDNFGQTPLSWVARNGHEAVVKLLLEKDAELESKNKQRSDAAAVGCKEGT